ncbi:MAG TPA: hypothetical protein VFP84_00610 [Kofleriaceae bacterium]|nr:hypothetical protein [Kofleriaceae bacterium]
MKKSQRPPKRKLILERDTIAQVKPQELIHVVGGVSSPQCSLTGPYN